MEIKISGDVKSQLKIEASKDRDSTRDEVIVFCETIDKCLMEEYDLSMGETQDTNDGCSYVLTRVSKRERKIFK